MSADAARAAACLAAGWGLVPQSLRCVARTDCEVWRFVPQGDTRELSLRIYAEQRQDAEPIDAEMHWLQALALQGLHVPAPLARPGGGWRAVCAPAAGRPARHAVLLHWLGGRQLFAGLRPLHLRRVGLLTAHLHASAARLQRSGQLQCERDAGCPDLDGWAEGRRPCPAWASPGLRTWVPRIARHFLERQRHWPRDEAHRGWIHGDLHPWNLLFQGNQAGAIDFSDGGRGWLAQDLAATLQFLRHPLPGFHDHRPQYPALRDALFEGYASVRALPTTLCAQAEEMLLLRQLHTLQWICDDWQDPDERPWGRGFVDSLPALLQSFLERPTTPMNA